jgi:hypothetical protein
VERLQEHPLDGSYGCSKNPLAIITLLATRITIGFGERPTICSTNRASFHGVIILEITLTCISKID